MPNALPLAAASARLKGKPGRPRTRPERPPAPVVQVGGVAPLAPRLLDVTGAALYLGVADDTIRDLDSRGVLKRVRLPGPGASDLRRVLFDRHDLDALIEQSKNGEGR